MFKVRTNLMAAFAKPLLCAGRFISTKFNLKNAMITVKVFTHYYEEDNSICFEKNDIMVTKIEDSYLDNKGFKILTRAILEKEWHDTNILTPNKWYSLTFINHLMEEDTDGSYYQWFEFVSAKEL